MEKRLKATKEKIEFLSIMAYHFLERYRLNENTLEQIVIRFNLTPIEVLRLTRKIQRLKQRYFINNQILARSIIKCRYTTFRLPQGYFDENSPLAIF